MKLKKGLFILLFFCAILVNYTIAFSLGSREQSNLKLIEDNNFSIIQSVYNSTSTQTQPPAISDDYGNTKETAQEITLENEIKGSIEDNQDYDFFRFSPKLDGLYHLYNFTAQPSSISGSVQSLKEVLYIYDLEGKPVNFECNIYGSVTIIDFELKKDSTYYISVSSSKSSPNFQYSFKLKGTNIDDVGDSLELAQQIKIGERVQGSADYCLYLDHKSDSDYFAFTPQEDGTYFLKNFETICDEGVLECPVSYVLFILDDNRQSVPLKGGEDCYNFQLSKGRIYYVYISSYNSERTRFKYSFNLEGPVEDDYSNDLVNASEIKLDDKIEGKGNFFFDTDSFKFTPTADGAYYIDDYIKKWSA